MVLVHGCLFFIFSWPYHSTTTIPKSGLRAWHVPVLVAQVLLGVKDDVSRSRLQSLKRTQDIMSATEGRIAALKAELAESEHQVVGLSNG